MVVGSDVQMGNFGGVIDEDDFSVRFVSGDFGIRRWDNGLQLLLGICWSWMYFGMHRPGWALAVMSLWLLAVFFTIKTFRPIKPQAFNLMLPVAGWLLFSWLLNLVQWHLNGGILSSVL